jgi:hypothetical protein
MEGEVNDGLKKTLGLLPMLGYMKAKNIVRKD